MEAVNLSPNKPKPTTLMPFDPILAGGIIILLCLGLVMVASASIAMAERQLDQPFYYLQRQAVFALLGVITAGVIMRFPLEIWERAGRSILLGAMLLLCIVLIPGIGYEVNGARRWLSFGVFAIQVSEFAKLAMIIYLASYIVRYADQVRNQFMGFIKPLLVLTVIAVLLLLEPDFGAVVITLTTLGMLFLAGVKFRHFFLLLSIIAAAFMGLIVTAPYRMQRLTSFVDPWADQFDTGYQLTQALIAFGRGEWLGVGLGQSVQKLFYLPEAHTDFIFAVMSEEFGLFGALVFLIVYIVVIARAFIIAEKARIQKQWFASYLAYGIALWFALQALISIGVNVGILPTKGLTLPFISYGGSSLLVTLIAVGLLFQVQIEVMVKKMSTPYVE